MTNRMFLDTLERIATETRSLNECVRRLEGQERSPYRESTWTPVLAGDTTAGTFTYDTTNTSAEYTRMGNRVLINGRLRITAVSVAPVGNLRITGLPITPSSGAFAIAGGVSFGLWSGITLTGGRTQLEARILSGVSSIQFIENGSGIAAAAVVGASFALIGGIADFQFRGDYKV